MIVCKKPSGKEFIAKLIAIEPEYFVFETSLGMVKRNRKGNIVSMKAVV
jgi:hypothetical protein